MGKTFTSSSVTRQYLAGIISSISYAVLGTSVVWLSPAIPKLMGEDSQVHLSHSELTWMASSIYIGKLLSPLPSGYSMDYFGRKRTLISVTSLSVFSWIIIYFATEPYQLYIARFFCGITNGMVTTILPMYVAEISEPKIRGSMGNIMSLMSHLGIFYEYSVGPYISYKGLVIATALVPILFVITFSFMPESPYYYAMKNNNDEAMRSLFWLRHNKTEVEVLNEMAEINSSTKKQIQLTKGNLKDLLTNKANRKALFIGICTTLFQLLSGIGALMSYSSVTIPKNSVSWLSVDQCVTILGAVWLITTFSSTPILDKFNRRTLLFFSSVGCGTCTLTAAIWFYLDEKTDVKFVDNIRWVPFVAILLHAEFFALGLGPLDLLIRGELFAANIKGKASGVIAIVAAIGLFLNAKTYLIIAINYGMYINFLIFTTSCFLSAIFTKFYIIETKDKSLKQIQDELQY